MNIYKKGLTPLIATVLLIGFTIVLTAVVMRWGGSLFKTTTTQTQCKSQGRLQCVSNDFIVSVGKANYFMNQLPIGESANITVNNEGKIPINKIVIQRQDTAYGQVSAIKDYNPNTLAPGTNDVVIANFNSASYSLAALGGSCYNLTGLIITPVIIYKPADGSTPCEITCTESQIYIPAKSITCF